MPKTFDLPTLHHFLRLPSARRRGRAAPLVRSDGSWDWHLAMVTSLSCTPHLRRVLRGHHGPAFELPAQAIGASLAYVEPVATSGCTAVAKDFFLQLVIFVAPQGAIPSQRTDAVGRCSASSSVYRMARRMLKILERKGWLQAAAARDRHHCKLAVPSHQ